MSSYEFSVLCRLHAALMVIAVMFIRHRKLVKICYQNAYTIGISRMQMIICTNVIGKPSFT